jgi:hypothetical protein
MDKKIDEFEQSIDELIAEICEALPPTAHRSPSRNSNQSIALAGVARIGKSLLAKKLASGLGYSVICTDS